MNSNPTFQELFACLVSFGLAWLGLVWFGSAWLGLAWLGLAWLGLVWWLWTTPLFFFKTKGFLKHFLNIWGTWKLEVIECQLLSFRVSQFSTCFFLDAHFETIAGSKQKTMVFCLHLNFSADFLVFWVPFLGDHEGFQNASVSPSPFGRYGPWMVKVKHFWRRRAPWCRCTGTQKAPGRCRWSRFFFSSPQNGRNVQVKVFSI